MPDPLTLIAGVVVFDFFVMPIYMNVMMNGLPPIPDTRPESEDERRERVQRAHDARFAEILREKNG